MSRARSVPILLVWHPQLLVPLSLKGSLKGTPPPPRPGPGIRCLGGLAACALMLHVCTLGLFGRGVRGRR